MAKINDGVGSGGTKVPSNEIFPENEIFTDEKDEMRGSTIGIEVLRAIKPKFDAEGTDSFETDSKVDIGAEAPRDNDPDFDIKKHRKESDTGLTFQMNQILLKRDIKG